MLPSNPTKRGQCEGSCSLGAAGPQVLQPLPSKWFQVWSLIPHEVSECRGLCEGLELFCAVGVRKRPTCLHPLSEVQICLGCPVSCTHQCSFCTIEVHIKPGTCCPHELFAPIIAAGCASLSTPIVLGLAFVLGCP